MKHLLLVLGLVVWPAAVHATTFVLAWDPVVGAVVTGYRLQYGTAPGQPTSIIDVGLATTATTPNLASGTYYFTAIAYNDAGISPPSNEVVGVATVQTDPACDYPLGNRSVSIFVTALQLTGSKGAGSLARLDFKVQSQNSPVTRAAVRTNGQDLAVMAGTDLGALAGLWFLVPAAPATYAISAAATNVYGCTREQLTTFTVTVK